ncbi:SDR family NAD(P)-dependent oxidoreductase [Sphingomonas montanisoli]|uniref:SDR family oxidoreductase n=1 Tax=Sphingomonas montanisoli TaxID=2606412 RepID=A0A5D9C2C2_9SPHN|nr:SDR family oxidoreductase [Sphingomonas montanisoli]TZG24161.1 SDR family oxidoreductase [Sphingomonas montanisoli]
MANKVAFITGASRGIGKACAIELADAGYDVAIVARTVTEGEQREHSSTLKASDLSPLPGSLESTSAAIRAKGVQCMAIQADLLDLASIGAAVTQVLERWGRIDLVLHNGRYIGPGHMDRFLETPISLLKLQMDANVWAPLTINQLVLPAMIKQGGGTIVNITSASGYGDPDKPAGSGGWGMGYGLSKGAFQRIAGFLKTELSDQGIRCFNIQPGLIATERIGQDMAKFGIKNDGAPMEVLAKVTRWLATDPDADQFNGKNIEAQFFCHEKGLLPGWGGPKIHTNNITYDASAANLTQLEKELHERLGA